MFFGIPLLLTLGILYLVGEFFFTQKWYQWLFIISAFILTWTLSGLIIFHRIGLPFFMEATDVLGNPVPWFDGDWTPWFVWIVCTIGACFVCSALVTFGIIWPFARKKWWQFWK